MVKTYFDSDNELFIHWTNKLRMFYFKKLQERVMKS